MKDERIIHTEVLERIEKDDESLGDSGTKMLKVSIDYKKEGRPRGYYLCLQVYLETDSGYQQYCLSFGDEGDPHKSLLLLATQAFRQKTFDSQCQSVPPDVLAFHVAEIKETYRRRRAAQVERANQHRARWEAPATI